MNDNLTIVHNTEIGTDLAYAAHLIRAGEIIAIPTETVYGLAANAFNEDAVRKIYNTKCRPYNNPLIVHVASINEIRSIVTSMPEQAELLLEKFCPGPLTLLLPRNELIPDVVTAGLPDVALRIPAHPLTLALLKEVGCPLAAPSANPFGYISPTKVEHVYKMLNGKIPYILDGSDCRTGIESTIVGFRDGIVTIFRQGAITKEAIEAVAGPVHINENKKTVASGMLYSHYAPNTPLYLTEDIEGMLKQFNNQNVGLLTYNCYSDFLPEKQQYLLYTENDFVTAAQNLYAALHQMDECVYDVIIVKKLPDQGLGSAINDKLVRASKR